MVLREENLASCLLLSAGLTLSPSEARVGWVPVEGLWAETPFWGGISPTLCKARSLALLSCCHCLLQGHLGLRQGMWILRRGRVRRAAGSQAGVSLQGPHAGQAGERDSCSVYGTGRIHCEQSRSVNYRRAINRAETDPRVSQEHLTPCGPTVGLDVGDGLLPRVWGSQEPRQRDPGGPAPLPSAWPILALAHFCLCLSALSNHVQCQYGKSGHFGHRYLPCTSLSRPHWLLVGCLAHLAQRL